MAKLPTPLQKRDILYGVKKVSEAELIQLAEDFLSEGWHSDALDFAFFAKSKEIMRKVQKIAVNEGHSFLYLKAHRLLGEEQVSTAELLDCARKAENVGQYRYALMAYEKLGMMDKVEEIKTQRIAEDGDIKQEAHHQVFIPEHSEELEGSEFNEKES